MSFPVSRIGDTSSHGGYLISTPITGVFVDTILPGVIGAMHACPIPGHGVTPIVSSPIMNVLIEGIPAAMVGSIAGCGAVMVTGSPTTNIL